ncbi:uncharacterized protein PG986_005731 [Apiospora aurea]|uniref:RBR-type E3 ubiquitin transferase n=1 Tax=Apiospora aurea TaxID=335848 RepID=A0ABR1QIE8_9PEZI
MTLTEQPRTPLVGIDDETVALILELQRQDGETLVSMTKGKQVEGTAPCDAEIALKLYLEEHAVATVSALDRRMASSIQTAVRKDADALKKLADEENVANQDRHLSLELSSGRLPEPTATSATPLQPIDSTDEDDVELIEKMSCIYVTGEQDSPDEGYDTQDDRVSVAGQAAESSAWAAFRPHRARRCIACGDRRHFTNVSRAPCQHEYCRDCLLRLFEDSMRDETLFPPRCCKRPLPLDKNILFLPQAVVETFRKKTVEFSTPNRTYCHRKECLAFISPARYVNGVARCGDCGANTCASCKGASHSGDCPHDENLQQVMELARSKGWQRCKECWTMAELKTGCYHITCRCGAQFCYICGTPWEPIGRGQWKKQCDCVQWDEHRLLERAAEIDARDHVVRLLPGPGAVLGPQGDGAAAAAVRARRINRLVLNLRENHECDHLRWRERPGPRECEECGDEMPLFIYECRQCHIMACRRCRYNSL